MSRLGIAITVFALATTALGTTAEGSPTDRAPAEHPAQFAVLPPAGAAATLPANGRLVLGLGPMEGEHWNVYADGRMIGQKLDSSGHALVTPPGKRAGDTGYVQRRLSARGVQLLRAKLLATGLFERDLQLDVGAGHNAIWYQVRQGNRIVSVAGGPFSDPSWKPPSTKVTPIQTRELEALEALLVDLAAWLPANAWVDRRVRPFVPSYYVLAIDRSAPELAKLPHPLREVLGGYKKVFRQGCQIITTDQTRVLLRAFADARIRPAGDSPQGIEFTFAGLGFSRPSYLHLGPALPGDHC